VATGGAPWSCQGSRKVQTGLRKRPTLNAQ
jgi:hypothetical protein